MAIRSYADVPNRVVQLFLQEAGAQYDKARGYKPFTQLKHVMADFDYACAYCGDRGPLREEHVTPRNREAVGLHAWGNVIPACKACNDRKGAKPWQEFIEALEMDRALRLLRIDRIRTFRNRYRYEPSVEPLKVVLEALYDLSDKQTRALIQFAVAASASYLTGLDAPPPSLGSE